MRLSYHATLEALHHLAPTPEEPLFGQPDPDCDWDEEAEEITAANFLVCNAMAGEFGFHIE